MVGLTKALWLAAASGLSLTPRSGLAAPSSPLAQYDGVLGLNETHPFAEFGFGRYEKRAGSTELRIMSFGASIMTGVGSTSLAGSRRYLRDALRIDGWDVNMVGSRCTGKMKDCNHEANSGDIITDAHARLPRSLGFKANVVLINLGTNDINRNIDIPRAGERMERILNDIWNADGMGKTCVLLSTLLPTTHGDGAANRASVNGQYRALVGKKAGEGRCIYMADMQPNGQEWFDLGIDFHSDEVPKVHPNDAGHKKMAAVWYKFILQADRDGKLVKPGEINVGPPDCDKFAGTGIDAGGRTQRGSGYEDGIYSHNSEGKGILYTRDSEWDRDQWKFARLFSPRYDDIVLWIDNSAKTENIFAVVKNSGDGNAKFTNIGDLRSAMYCDSGKGVFFLDMNADGLDDYVCIDAKGNAFLSINQGNGDRGAGRPPSFKYVGKIMDTKTGTRERIVMADIDGDGRGDYGAIDGSSTIRFWRNGWVDDKPSYWQDLGVRWNGNFGDPKAVRFEDLNGDGRDDFMVVNDEDGGITTYTNSRSCQKGKEGGGLNVAWRQATLRNGEASKTHLGVKDIANGDKSLRKRVHLARIYGTQTAFGNQYRQDYVYLKHKKDGNTHKFEMHVWKNVGEGGTKIKVDGNKYCNMMGHEDGSVDYVWAFQGGDMEMWASRGKKTITNADPDGWWRYEGSIWKPPKAMHRKDLHLQDWNGDGVCDIIWNDPDNNNAVSVWINNHAKTGKWDWTYLSNPAPGVQCREKRGIGATDLAVRFADITGNKRADYLCIKPNGLVTAYLQRDDGNWEDAGQVKVDEGHDRANLRWADVNGDGRDDLLWIEKFSGDTFVSYNNGRGDRGPNHGSSFNWRKQADVAYAGLAAGSCIFYADFDGSGRVDEHYVLESFNNIAETSLSPICSNTDVTGDDPDMSKDLPEVPGTNDQYCTAGTGPGDLAELCSYVCQFNFCQAPCTCTATGPLRTAPEPNSPGGSSNNGDANVDKLCEWSCSRSYCPSKSCKSSGNPDGTCQWDPQEAEAWDRSGAASLVDNYIQAYTNDDWLRGMDVLFYLGSGHSNLNCDDVSSNACPAPQGACKDWQSPEFWYVRNMVSRVNSHFKFAHEKLQDTSIRSLGLVDQMIIDFKMDPPDIDALKATMSTLAAISGLSSLLTKRATAYGADIFTLIGGIVLTTNAQTRAEPDNLDKFAAAAKAYVVDILDKSNEQLEKTLPAFFGNGDLARIDTLYDKLVASGIVPQSKRISSVSRVLDGGGMMVPVLESDVASAISDGIKDSIAAVLGGLLSSLHYFVVRVIGGTDESCSLRKACRVVDDDLYYLIRREKSSKKSETVPDKAIAALEESYKINLAEMIRNIRDCNNKRIADSDRNTIYIGANRYPDCYFSVGYGSSGGLDLPLTVLSNKNEVPKWVGDSDLWNDARKDLCSTDAYKNAPACRGV